MKECVCLRKMLNKDAFISFREVSGDSEVLQRVDRIIQTEYLDFPKFKSSIVFKATWNNMAFFMDISKVK